MLPEHSSTRSVDTEIEIHASSDRVWSILTDFSRYGEWNPFIVKVDGSAAPGTRLAVTTRLPVGVKMNFKLGLEELKPPQEMIWTGQTLFPGLLDGEHYFRVDRVSEDRVMFRQGEGYAGALLYPAWPFLKWSVTRSFNDMNAALKKTAER